jgi:DNA invertase Pin-like site-specific DNA recombinase
MAVVKYLRQSMGSKASIRQQDESGDERAAELDQVVYATLRDYTSASRYARKRREDWDKLLALLPNTGVTLVWLWEPSRGSRELEDWAHFLSECRRHKVQIWVETHEQVYDMHNHRHWRTLAEEGISSQAESDNTSKRVRRNVQDGIKRGRPRGKRAYGWRRVYAEVDGKPKLKRQEADETEAPVVREAWARAKGGESLNSISADFRARGIRTRAWSHRRTGEPMGGTEFTPQRLRRMLLTPAYAGIRAYCPEGSTAGRGTLSPGTTVYPTDPEVWEPLVSQEDYYAVEAMLTAHPAPAGRPGRGVHQSSWLVRCGKCRHPLGTRRHHSKWVYFCPGCSGVTCQKAALDNAIDRAVLGYLGGCGFAQDSAARQASTPDAALAGVRGKLEALRAAQRGLGARYAAGAALPEGAAGKLSLEAFVQADGDLKGEIKNLEARQREIAGMTKLDAILGDPSRDLEDRWRRMPVSARRKVLRILFTPEHMGQPLLAPAPDGAKRTIPVTERLEWQEAGGRRRHPAPDSASGGLTLSGRRVARWADASDYQFRDVLKLLGWAADPQTCWTPRIPKAALVSEGREHALAGRLGKPVPFTTVSRRLAELEALGVIQVNRDRHVTGGRRGLAANAYRIDFTRTVVNGSPRDGYDFTAP